MFTSIYIYIYINVNVFDCRCCNLERSYCTRCVYFRLKYFQCLYYTSKGMYHTSKARLPHENMHTA